MPAASDRDSWSLGSTFGTIQLVRRSHRLGWLTFVASAILFGWAGVRSGDAVVVAASILFGAGCVVFLVFSAA